MQQITDRDLNLAPCPICGKEQNADCEHTLRPSGIAWRDDLGIVDETTPFRHYVTRDDPRGVHGICYEVICNRNIGGCGFSVDANSKEEVIEKWNDREVSELLPCPLCGMTQHPTWDDTLYPSGSWKIVDGQKVYSSYPSDPDRNGFTYGLHCAVVYGGCGASIEGDSKEEAIEKWNTRKG